MDGNGLTQTGFRASADQTADTALHVRATGSGPISRGPPILFVAVVAGEVLEGPRSGCVTVAGKTLGEAGFEAIRAVSERLQLWPVLLSVT